MVKCIILLLLIMACSSAYAHEQKDYENIYEQKEKYEKEKYKNWPALEALLKEKGIESSQVDWQPIESTCLNIQSSTSKTNKCRYKKAVNQVQHKKDSEYCNTPAEQKPPFSTCMIGLGWNNPESWLAGKRDEEE